MTPGLKTGLENSVFWSEIGSGFGEPGGTPPPNIRCNAALEVATGEVYKIYNRGPRTNPYGTPQLSSRKEDLEHSI